MKVLNLAYPAKSDIKFLVSKFPDGQQQVSNLSFHQYHLRYGSKSKEDMVADPVTVKSRLNNFMDLELIICAVKSLRAISVKEIHLYVPYFLGARSDRSFKIGGNNYLRDVICPIINSLNFDSVTVLDPHSDVLEACLNGFKKESNGKLAIFAIKDFQKSQNGHSIDKFIPIFPDSGSVKKGEVLLKEIGYNGDFKPLICSKNRDVKTGKIVETIVPISSFMKKEIDMVIFDDICDGGATFVEIAKVIKNHPEARKNRLFLIITHGIFSKGFKELAMYFDGVYCTNSYKGLTDTEEFVLGQNKRTSTFVKQLNVF